jgi:hypothetical protein
VSREPDAEFARLEQRVDVLSTEEENVLSNVRDIVAGMRAMGSMGDLAILSQRLTDAGAFAANERETDGRVGFVLGGVRFLLRTVPHAGFEISFQSPNP